MRTQVLFDTVDASSNQTSDNVNMDKRTDWDLVVTADSLDAIPRIIIEMAYTGGGCLPEPSDWYPVENCNGNEFFGLTSPPLIVHKSGFTPNWYRIRLEPNGNTTGTVTAILGYKDYP
jgi:hypothetical protein